MRGPFGALFVGDVETIAAKILALNEALGGISRLTFQMTVATLPPKKLLWSIEFPGTEVRPLLQPEVAPLPPQAMSANNR